MKQDLSSRRRPLGSSTLPPGCYLSFATLGLGVAALGPALPFLAEATASPLKRISYLFIAQNLGYMAGSYASGLLYDRFRSTRMVGIALLVMAAGLSLVPAAGSFALLAMLITGLGLLQGAVDVGGNVLILRTPAAGRQVRMNALHLFFGVGALLAPVAMAQAVLRTGGIRWGYWVLALLAVPAGLWMVGQPDPPASAKRAEREESSAQTLIVVIAAVCIFLIVAAEAGFGSWIYTYAVTRRLADKVDAAYLTSVFWGAFAVGRLVSTLASLRLRPPLLIALSVAGCLAGAVPLLVPGGGAPAAWTAAACFGFFVSPLFANTMTFTGEAVHISGRVAGIFLVGTSLGGLFLPWLIGQLFQSAGPQVVPVAVLVTMTVTAGFYVLLIRQARQPLPPRRPQARPGLGSPS